MLSKVSKFSMQLFSCFAIGGVSQFFRQVQSERVVFSISNNLCSPFSVYMPRNSFVPRCIFFAFSGIESVLIIGGRTYFAAIQSVVIRVIYFTRRPLAVSVQISQPMHQIITSFDTYVAIPVSVYISCYFSGTTITTSAFSFFRYGFFPTQFHSVFVEIKNRANEFYRKIVLGIRHKSFQIGGASS